MKAKYSLRSSAHRLCSSACFGLLIAVLLGACGNPGTGHRDGKATVRNDKFSRFATDMNITPVSEKMMLIIPTQGCTGCIKEALDFTAAHDSRSSLTTVVSGRSKRFYKLLTHKFNIDTTKVFFDREALAARYGIITIYPVLLRAGNDGHITSTQLDAKNVHRVLTDAGLLVD
ncbi:hypothetical protein KK062_06650 [Fulvivirgaceae bacterium PWU5]|uniref:Uncharacterized protein n=1 Tax=Dawidia cretensis TaxID=2782350 RepID=A0AAP2GNU5_9BACT|nr:hypothetical protein [Dawidia cretensis]MBT1707891.1 hypothetical protein [Dawidia cretensis]